MVRLPRAGRGHEIAGREIADPLADRDDFARHRVADRPALRVQIRDGTGGRRRRRSATGVCRARDRRRSAICDSRRAALRGSRRLARK